MRFNNNLPYYKEEADYDKRPLKDKSKEREEIQELTAEFEANGGKVTYVGHTTVQELKKKGGGFTINGKQ